MPKLHPARRAFDSSHAVEPSLKSANPEITILIFVNGSNMIITQTVGIVRIMSIMSKIQLSNSCFMLEIVISSTLDDSTAVSGGRLSVLLPVEKYRLNSLSKLCSAIRLSKVVSLGSVVAEK